MLVRLEHETYGRSPSSISKDQYTITLSSANAPGGFLNSIAAFGAQRYTGRPTALQYIEQMPEPPVFAGMTSHSVSLGNGITGKLYSDVGIVRWHEGLWTLDVEAGSARSDVALAMRIVAYLHKNLLPETHGWMWVKNTPGGRFSHSRKEMRQGARSPGSSSPLLLIFALKDTHHAV